MILFFFLFVKHFIVDDDSIEFNEKRISINSSMRYALSSKSTWYFVKFPEVQSEFSAETFISPFWQRRFLSPSESVSLRKVASLRPISSDEKTDGFTYNNTRFYAEFHSSFTPESKDDILTYKHLWKGFYEITTKASEAIDHVLNIPELLSICDAPINRYNNRWTVGFPQKNQHPGMSKLGYSTPRYLSDHGLTGLNQVISVVDGGLDVNSSFFYDPNNKFVFNTYNKNHRKVVLYDSYANQYDSETNGHGTHVCGSAAGNSICGNEQSFYNGAAYDARIHFIDIGANDAGRSLVSYPVTLLSEGMGVTHSKVNTNSWGSSSRNSGQTNMYNSAAKNLDNRAFFFSAGNEGKNGYATINSPGDAKNVVTVGMFDELYNQRGDSLSKSISLLGNNGQYYSITQISGTSYDRITRGIKEIPTSTSSSDNNKVYLTTNPNSVCSLNPVPYAAIIANQMNPSCTPTSPFPIFRATSSGQYSSLMTLTTVTVEITVPSSNLYPSINGMSSLGPTHYGIIKPDVVGPGTNIISAASQPKTTSGGHGCNPVQYVTKTGTSMSTPIIAGNAVLIAQYFLDGFYPTGSKVPSDSLDPDANLIRAVVIGSADPVANANDRSPNNVYGHGAVNLANILKFDGSMRVVMNQPIQKNQEMVLTFSITNNAEEKQLRIAMAYLDEASTSENSPLVADLDMFIVLPDRSIIYGNMHKNNHEEHFSTCEKIVLDENKVQIGKYELHIVGGGNFEALFEKTAHFSLIVVGPLNGGLSQFTTMTPKTCDFPKLGVNCQLEATKLDNHSSVTLHPSMATYTYFELPSHFTNLTIIITRPIDIAGRIIYQLTPKTVPLYPNQYAFTVASGDPIFHLKLKNDTFKDETVLGFRLANACAIQHNADLTFVYDQFVKPVPVRTFPPRTIKPNTIVVMSIGYGLFIVALAFMLIMIMNYVFKKQSFKRLGSSK